VATRDRAIGAVVLIVMRHGKSDWSTRTTDHARPLTERGIRSARVMGRLLTDVGLVPDLVITSTAVRARSTAELATAAGGWTCPVEATDGLYDAGVDDVIELVRGVDDAVDRCMIVGHEPTWSALVAELTGAGVAMRTATVAVIDRPARWAWLGQLPSELVALFQPRQVERLYPRDE
jgi:phosphohistidine phosphatase